MHLLNLDHRTPFAVQIHGTSVAILSLGVITTFHHVVGKAFLRDDLFMDQSSSRRKGNAVFVILFGNSYSCLERGSFGVEKLFGMGIIWIALFTNKFNVIVGLPGTRDKFPFPCLARRTVTQDCRMRPIGVVQKGALSQAASERVRFAR